MEKIEETQTLRRSLITASQSFEAGARERGYTGGSILLMLPTPQYEAFLDWHREQSSDDFATFAVIFSTMMAEQSPCDLVSIVLRGPADAILCRLRWSEYVVSPRNAVLTAAESLLYK